MARAKLQDLLNVSRGSARGAEVCKLRLMGAPQSAAEGGETRTLGRDSDETLVFGRA